MVGIYSLILSEIVNNMVLYILVQLNVLHIFLKSFVLLVDQSVIA